MAGFILDSNAFLAFKAGQIGARTREALTRPENTVYLSLASIWELGIKAANGKLEPVAALFAAGSNAVAEMLEESGLVLLPIDLGHVIEATALPQHHRDPFDRIIIAQARIEGLTVATSDRMFARYVVPVLAT